MLKLKKSVIVLLLLSTGFLATGCYGSFNLTKKVYKWNGTMGDKWMNSIVFYALNVVGVYGITTFVDAVVLNTLEFWTGSNPMAMNEGESETKYVTDAGKTYKITASKNQFEVSQVAGPNAVESAVLAFNPESSVWSVTSGSTSIDIAKFVTNGSETVVEAYMPNGTEFFTLNGEKVANLNTAN
ncbi:MAG: DUF3332 family protein [Bacteroidetes bacterium]|nr:DUF3332 family protein [Bacteroidota bacterium]NCQ11179.1 DUF3332 family protein [Bacteroidota bacterium]